MCLYYRHIFSCNHSSLVFADFCTAAALIQTPCPLQGLPQPLTTATKGHAPPGYPSSPASPNLTGWSTPTTPLTPSNPASNPLSPYAASEAASGEGQRKDDNRIWHTIRLTKACERCHVPRPGSSEDEKAALKGGLFKRPVGGVGRKAVMTKQGRK